MQPSLHEIQLAMRRSLLDEADDAALGYIVAAGLAPGQRLSVYRNTVWGALANALRLSYPAVQRLVGAEFFDGAARIFARGHPPQCADLNAYGAEFADFLQRFEPAASLAYLPDVARLEWAVNRALHAPDVPALDLAQLAALAPADHDRVSFTPHPSITLLRSDYPIDAIWRGVLQQDDAVLAAIDPAAGAVHLLVQRSADEANVLRLEPDAWRFANALFAGQALGDALAAPGAPAAEWLAQHFAEGRCIAFHLHGESET